MTSTDFETENQVVVDTALASAEPVILEEGKRYAFVLPGGGVHVVDNDHDVYRDHPRRKTGHVQLRTAQSLVQYVDKHAMAETELYADVDTGKVVAVINAHGGSEEDTNPGPAGWGDHRATLTVKRTPAWQAWANRNGAWMSQLDFAEHLEDRLVDIVKPTGADMLELAQTFQANRSVAFKSSKRLTNGETQLEYREEIDATAGKIGQIAIPDRFTLALIPFEGGDAIRVDARLRYRINGQQLMLSYVLDRPEEILALAFDGVLEHIETEAERTIYRGTPTG